MNVRALEDEVIRHIEASDVWQRIVSAWLDAPLTEQERAAFIMWLVGHPTADIARVLVAYEGKPNEHDGVTRTRVHQLLANARRKVTSYAGIEVPNIYDHIPFKPSSRRVQDGQVLCSRCKRMLPVSAFQQHAGNASGIRTYCRECTRELDRAQRRKGTA